MSHFARVARQAESDELQRVVNNLEELQRAGGWRWLVGVLAAQRELKTREIMLPPKTGERADTYGLKAARAAGVIEGLGLALDAPNDALLRIREELAGRQKAVERAAREEQ